MKPDRCPDSEPRSPPRGARPSGVITPDGPPKTVRCSAPPSRIRRDRIDQLPPYGRGPVMTAVTTAVEVKATPHRLLAPDRGAGAAPRGGRRVPDRVPAPRGPRRHPGARRSVARAVPRGARRAGRAARREPAHGAGAARQRGDHRARRAPALGPQGPAREGRAHRGAVLT